MYMFFSLHCICWTWVTISSSVG
uniref:Uncharacterized protein n=1 Tax=Rhizophora mucronata TaxID=61149 RepID=A0A2P2QCW2_RHIMU